MKYAHGFAWPDADEFMVRELAADGTYQADHLAAAFAYVTDRRTAIDGGAHIGTWSRLLAGSFDEVIAVEPAADTYAALCENLRTFRCLNVEPRRCALGAEAGMVSLANDAANLARANTGARHVAPGDEVPLVTIDSWNLSDLGFLKLDIEGSEPMALAGATETIRRCRPIILFEDKRLWQKHYGLPVDAPQAILRRLGYRELQRVGCDVIWGPA